MKRGIFLLFILGILFGPAAVSAYQIQADNDFLRKFSTNSFICDDTSCQMDPGPADTEGSDDWSFTVVPEDGDDPNAFVTVSKIQTHTYSYTVLGRSGFETVEIGFDTDLPTTIEFVVDTLTVRVGEETSGEGGWFPNSTEMLWWFAPHIVGTPTLADGYDYASITIDSRADSDFRFEIAGIEPAPVPEPAALLLFGIGVIGVAAQKRKRLERRRQIES